MIAVPAKLAKVLFLTESEITLVAKELKKTSHRSRFICSQSALIMNIAFRALRESCRSGFNEVAILE